MVKDFLDWVLDNQINGEKVKLTDLHSNLKGETYK